MSLAVGIAGLPNVGKSTLLNALTHAGADASNYPFCTIDQNVGVAAVPDPDLEQLEKILEPEEALPPSVRFVDIAGLVEGASKGEGLGNKFLGHIRETDAILHVVRCFEDENVAHPTGAPDPVRDAAIVETEFLLADLDAAERALSKWKRTRAHGTGAGHVEADVFERIVAALRAGTPASAVHVLDKEQAILDEARFITAKPILYVANTDESDPKGDGPLAAALRQAKGADRVLPVSIRIEEEMAELAPEERAEFIKDLGLAETGLNQVIRGCYRLLDLITFYTIANNKLRGWQLTRDGTALDAAGKIHTDMAKGFIRAEVMALRDLRELGSRQALHDRGLIHTVGRDYAVQDKDVLQVHFKA